MYIQKIREQLPEPRAFSLKIPEYSLIEVETIIVACCEDDSIPSAKELEKLQPLAYILVPGALIHAPPAELRTSAGIMHPPPEAKASYNFFKSVLTSMPNAKDIIICTHSGCKFETSNDPLQQLDDVSKILIESPILKQREIRLHVWHYEPEINWVSFFDVDTNLMLPLNANINLFERSEHAS